MPIDTSMYSNLGQGVTPLESPMDAMSKAMAFSSLANRNKIEGIQAQQAQQSFNDSQAMKNAMNNNTKVDPETGAVSRDNAGMFKDLAAGGNTHLVPQVQSQIASMNDAMLKANLEKTSAASQMLQGIEAIKDPVKQQAAYTAMRNSPIAQTAGSANWPEQHDPEFVAGLGQQTMTHTQLLESEAKDRGLSIQALEEKNKEKQLALDSFKVYGNPNGPAVKQSADPAQAVLKKAPVDLRAKAMEEIKDNQNIAKIAGPSLEAFDKAAQDARPMTGGVHGASGSAFMPHIPFVGDFETPGQKAFSGMANTTVKEVEGTARQAAFESIKDNFRPQFGDSDANIARKRAGWINYLQSHTASPVNDSFGNHLSQYNSTTIDPKYLNASNPDNKSSPDIHPKLQGMSLDELKQLKSKMSQSNAK